jgi:thiol-disulfide isomerase/thioredoxin
MVPGDALAPEDAFLDTAKTRFRLLVAIIMTWVLSSWGCDQAPSSPDHQATVQGPSESAGDGLEIRDRSGRGSKLDRSDTNTAPQFTGAADLELAPAAVKSASAEDSLESLLPDDRSDAPDVLEQASAALRSGDAEEAVRLAQQALTAEPDRREVALKVAEILIRSRYLDEGIDLLEQTWDQHQSDTKIALMLVSAHRLRARTSEDAAAQLGSMRRAGDLVRHLARERALRPFGKQGRDLFLQVSLHEAALCSAGGLKDQTLSALRGILELGYVEIAALADHRVWDPIRDAPEFQSLIAEYRSRIREQLQVGALQVMQEQATFPFQFRLPDYKGRTVSSSRFAGKIVVVDFWGTWCGPCRRMSPHLIRLHREYQDQLTVVGIAYEKTVRSRWAEAVASYVRQHNVPYPCLLGDEATKQLAEIDAFPTLLFIDRSGEVRLSLRGYHSFERLDAIAHLLMDEA